MKFWTEWKSQWCFMQSQKSYIYSNWWCDFVQCCENPFQSDGWREWGALRRANRRTPTKRTDIKFKMTFGCYRCHNMCHVHGIKKKKKFQSTKMTIRCDISNKHITQYVENWSEIPCHTLALYGKLMCQ